jgi:hypothetical protein
MFLGSRARPVSKAYTLPPFVSRLFRQCGILNIAQPYRPPRPVTGIALLLFSTRYPGHLALGDAFFFSLGTVLITWHFKLCFSIRICWFINNSYTQFTQKTFCLSNEPSNKPPHIRATDSYPQHVQGMLQRQCFASWGPLSSFARALLAIRLVLKIFLVFYLLAKMLTEWIITAPISAGPRIFPGLLITGSMKLWE